MAASTGGTGSLAGSWITDERGLRPRGGVAGVVNGNVVELGLAHVHEQRLHEIVLALTIDVSLHRRDQVLLAQPGQARHSRALADAALAVTPRTFNELAACSVLVALD